MLLVKCQLFVSFLGTERKQLLSPLLLSLSLSLPLFSDSLTLSLSPFSLSLSHSLALLSLVLFVVSSPGLVLNVDVRDELLGYVADVRRAAVSCLQLHLEISFLQPRCPPLLFLSLFLRVPA